MNSKCEGCRPNPLPGLLGSVFVLFSLVSLDDIPKLLQLHFTIDVDRAFDRVQCSRASIERATSLVS